MALPVPHKVDARALPLTIASCKYSRILFRQLNTRTLLWERSWQPLQICQSREYRYETYNNEQLFFFSQETQLLCLSVVVIFSILFVSLSFRCPVCVLKHVFCLSSHERNCFKHVQELSIKLHCNQVKWVSQYCIMNNTSDVYNLCLFTLTQSVEELILDGWAFSQRHHERKKIDACAPFPEPGYCHLRKFPTQWRLNKTLPLFCL